jgi:thiol:disulfide interchange protein
VTWFAPIELAADADLSALKISGKLRVQACGPQGCEMPRDYPFVARLGKGVAVSAASAPPAAPPDEPVKTSAQVKEPVKEPSSEAATGPIQWQRVRDKSELKENFGIDAEQVRAYLLSQRKAATPLETIGWLLAAFVGGLVLNVMPCVLPVIGLKVLSFVEQSGHDRRKALMLNIWYSLGLLSVFMVLGSLAVFFRVGWGELYTNERFGITMVVVVFVMALSFLGVWELPIPGFAGRGKGAELAAREGATGAFFKGVLSTVLATPCSAPLLGPALVWGAWQPPALTYGVFATIGLGMASPYLLIGAFPALTRFLPKPGAWMDTFKQVMGFVLLATVWFILYASVTEPQLVPTLGFLFGLWGACWWIGRISPVAETSAKLLGWGQAIGFAACVWVLMFSLFARHTEAKIETPLRISSGPATVLVDFTADWCLTCKALEKTVLHSQDVMDAIRKNRVVTLQGDWTHGEAGVTEMLDHMLLSKQVPVIAIFSARDPNRPTVFYGSYTPEQILDALEKAGATP